MVDAIVSVTVQKLGDFLIQEATCLLGVKDELVSIRDELIWMQSFLKDAEQKQGTDERIRLWISEIISIANETEDIIDTLERKTYDTAIGKEIIALEEKLYDISNKREDYGISYISNTQEIAKAASQEEPFLSFVDDNNLLETKICWSTMRRSVISILGIGGSGKTSLARKLYHAQMDRFDLHAWVCVSQGWNTKDLLRRILKSLKEPIQMYELKKIEMMDDDDIERYLHELLKDKVYLVVIDDMWDKEALECLKSALPDNQNQSRVIITTHSGYVSELSDEIHKLRHLRADESWELFCKNAFSNQNNVCPQHLEKVGKEMVAKCDGLPLAIIVLGGLLSRKESNEWYVIKKHIWGALIDSSIHISALLDLSYNDLSHELKSCFLYLGIFPEDHEICTEKLIQLWIAEDLVAQSEGWDLKELAKNYINELSARNLIEQITTADTLNPTYRVHGLLRDLAVNKAKELDFFHIYEESMNPAIVPFSTKRIAFRSGFESYMVTIDDHFYSQVHTLSFLNYHGVLDDGDATKLLTLINTKFKSLRVLDLDGVRIVTAQSKLKLLESMEKLVDLKYLGLSQINIDMLPESVGNLQALHEQNFIGLDEDVRLLETQLLSSQFMRSVVSILGKGGSGKTTLARKLYHTHKNSFEFHAWVCVSRKWDVKDLLERIINSLKELTTDELSKLEKLKVDEDDMRRYLHDLLKDRQYLVVIDDIWNEEAWECLESALPNNQNGSRVIITSRNELVAELSNQRTYVHKLRRLRADESWELFSKKAFANQNSACSQDLEEIGKELVHECFGLPLAIIVLGGFLSRKQSNEWRVLKYCILKAVYNTCIDISPLLDLSYYDLSHGLKSCFLHLSIFLEDYEIGIDKLVRLWIDDDLIPQSEGQDLEELAESYINELNGRCLIQLIRSNDSSTSICRVHDLLRDFAIKKAKNLIFSYADEATIPISIRRIIYHLGYESLFTNSSNDSTLMGMAEYGNKAAMTRENMARKAREKILLLGTAVSELLKAVKDVKKEISTFKPSLERLESTLTTITRFYKGKNLLKQSETGTRIDLDVLIRDGKELVVECSQNSRHDIDKKCRYWTRLCDLDRDLLSYLISVLEVNKYREVEKVQVVVRKLDDQRDQPYDFDLENIREESVVESKDEEASSNNPSDYCGKTAMTSEDRAREALSTIEDWNKRAVRNHVETLEIQSRNGLLCTKFFLYNATGDTVTLVATSNLSGNEWSVPCPSQIENGQWGGFLRVGLYGIFEGTVVYRGKNLKDEYCDWIFSWKTPLFKQPRVFTEIRKADHYKQSDYQMYINDKLKKSAKKHYEDIWSGCSSSVTIRESLDRLNFTTEVVVEAILTLKLD